MAALGHSRRVRGVFGVSVFAPTAEVSLIAVKRRDEPMVSIGGSTRGEGIGNGDASSSESERSTGTSVAAKFNFIAGVPEALSHRGHGTRRS